MLEKGMHKSWTVLQNGARTRAEIEKKTVKNEVRKTMRKRAHMQDGRHVAGAFLRLIISSRLVFRLVLTSLYVSERLVTSREVVFPVRHPSFRPIFASSDPSWHLVASSDVLYHLFLSRLCLVRSKNDYECLRPIARSLKRQMLHTSSRLVAGCEF